MMVCLTGGHHLPPILGHFEQRKAVITLGAISAFFDVRTLSFVTGIIALCLGFCMAYVAATRKTYPGFGLWTVASIVNGVGMLGVSLRGILPDILTIVVANVFIGAFFVLIARGLIEFIDGEQKRWVDLSCIVILATTFSYFTYCSPNVSVRVVIISLIIAFLSFRNGFLVSKKVTLILSDTNWLLLASFVFLGVVLLLRAVLTVAFENQIANFMSASILQGLSFIAVFIGNITIVTGLIIINAQRLERDLMTANDQVKSLSGLLPICSNCKKILDDNGVWHELTHYVQNHSEADFSHSICPDCLEKLYPEYAGRVLGKKP